MNPDCNIEVTTGVLRVAKFVNDSKQLLRNGTPMPGTVLNLTDGTPDLLKSPEDDELTFPDRLVQKTSMRSEVIELIWPGMFPPISMDKVKKPIN